MWLEIYHKKCYATTVCSSDIAVLIKIICTFCKISSSHYQFGDARAPHDTKRYMSAKSAVSRKADLNINNK